MNRSANEIQNILSTFHAPDRTRYPELQEYSRDQCYEEFLEAEVYTWLRARRAHYI